MDEVKPMDSRDNLFECRRDFSTKPLFEVGEGRCEGCEEGFATISKC